MFFCISDTVLSVDKLVQTHQSLIDVCLDGVYLGLIRTESLEIHVEFAIQDLPSFEVQLLRLVEQGCGLVNVGDE